MMTRRDWLLFAAFAALIVALVALLVAAVRIGDATARPAVTGEQRAATAYARCLADLQAEHARWIADPSAQHDPASCDQPGVSHLDYARAFSAAGGGSPWVLP